MTIQLTETGPNLEKTVTTRIIPTELQQEITDWLNELLGVAPTIFCDNCKWEGIEDNLTPFSIPEEWENCIPARHDYGCPNCGTDYYLTNIEHKK